MAISLPENKCLHLKVHRAAYRVCGFRIILIGFQCTPVAWDCTRRPSASSSVTYFSTVARFEYTERKFSGAGLRRALRLKPIWKPWSRPLVIKAANSLFGCRDKYSVHWSTGRKLAHWSVSHIFSLSPATLSSASNSSVYAYRTSIADVTATCERNWEGLHTINNPYVLCKPHTQSLYVWLTLARTDSPWYMYLMCTPRSWQLKLTQNDQLDIDKNTTQQYASSNSFYHKLCQLSLHPQTRSVVPAQLSGSFPTVAAVVEETWPLSRLTWWVLDSLLPGGLSFHS